MVGLNSVENFEPEHVVKKQLSFKKTGVKIGHGKYHPIELIIKSNNLFALKRIPKSTIDKQKRIDHLKNEKRICQLVKDKTELPEFFIHLEDTYAD